MFRRFNIRVYGLLIVENALLVSDEYIKGKKITKLPGGGLEFGEGTRDCLMREFKEEMDLNIAVLDHFYTTDFFVNSSFDTSSQVISIYYLVKATEPLRFEISNTAHNHKNEEGAQSFRWIDLNELKDTDFTLIIDQKVGEMLLK